MNRLALTLRVSFLFLVAVAPFLPAYAAPRICELSVVNETDTDLNVTIPLILNSVNINKGEMKIKEFTTNNVSDSVMSMTLVKKGTWFLHGGGYVDVQVFKANFFSDSGRRSEARPIANLKGQAVRVTVQCLP